MHWILRTFLDRSKWQLFWKPKKKKGTHKYVKRALQYSQVNSEYVIIYNPSNGKKFINSLDGSANIHPCYTMYNEQCNIIHSIPFSDNAMKPGIDDSQRTQHIAHETVIFSLFSAKWNPKFNYVSYANGLSFNFK